MEIQQGGNGSEPVLDVEYDIPAGAAVEIRLLGPKEYTAVVRVPKADNRADISISEDDFDCNQTEYQTTIHPDGRIEVTEVSTTMACSTATG